MYLRKNSRNVIYPFSTLFLLLILQSLPLGDCGRRLENAVPRVVTVHTRVLVRVNRATTAQTALARNACVTVHTQRQMKTLVMTSAASVSTL